MLIFQLHFLTKVSKKIIYMYSNIQKKGLEFMKVNSIGCNYSIPQFSGKNKKNSNVEYKNNKNKKVLVIKPEQLSDNAKKALKTLLISAMIATPAVTNTSCEKWSDVDVWVNPDPESYKDYMYILPPREESGIKMPADTVNVKHNFKVNKDLNNNLNTMLNALNIPRFTEGALPVGMSWLKQKENGDKSLVRLSLNDANSAEGKYVYDSMEYTESGLKNTGKLIISNNGNDINASIEQNGQTKNYTFKREGREIVCYDSDSNAKKAVYCESVITDENSNEKHCVVKENFDENGQTSALDLLSGFRLWSYSPDLPNITSLD